MKGNRQLMFPRIRVVLIVLLGLWWHVSVAQRQVSGRITDDTASPLVGVNVTSKAANRATSTDEGGRFVIQVTGPDDLIIVSAIGYEEESRAVGTAQQFDIVLTSSVSALEEVVVVGYGTQKKANLTGAISEVSGAVLKNRPIVNSYQGLQGAVPGLNLTTNGQSGELGGTYNVNIRGYTSINGGEPLVLIDGVRGSLQMVNPADIENITVLKDQAASAIYGAQAAYGVLMITTKQGQRGKTRLTYNNNFSTRSPIQLPRNMNSLDFAHYFNEAAINDNIAAYFDDDAIARIEAYLADPVNTPVAVPTPTNPNVWGKHWFSNANTDWYPTIYKENVFDHNHNLSVSGGSENLTYYLSGSFLQQDGLIRYGNPNHDKYTINGKIDGKINKWLSIGFDAKRTTQKVDKPTFLSSTLYSDLSLRWPNNYVIDPNGYYSNFSEVLKLTEGGRSAQEISFYNTTGRLVLEPIKGWVTNVTLTKTETFQEEGATDIPVWEYGVDLTPVNVQGITAHNEDRSKQDYINGSIYSTIDRSYGGHHIKAMMGWQYEYNRFKSLTGKRLNLLNNSIASLSAASGDQFASDGQYEWANNGVFGRFNYDYLGKYLLEINARADGSSVFPEERRWGLFPSISVGYVLSEEAYWENLKSTVNYFKLRGSYGKLGNQNFFAGSFNDRYYPYIAVMPVTLNSAWLFPNESSRVYVGAPNLISRHLTWETVRGWNIGITAHLLDHRLTADLDIYRRITEDMLGPVAALPAILGAAAPVENNATLSTKGFEFTVGWKDRMGGFQYGVTANLSDASATINEYNNPTLLNTTYYPGAKLGEIWGYETAGIFQSIQEVEQAPSQVAINAQPWMPGDIQYRDLNNDGVINWGNNTVGNPGDRKVVGNSTPRYNYSLIFNGEWKFFDFSMFWQGVGKRDIWISNSLFWGVTGGSIWSSSGFVPHLDYWSETNTDAYYARPLITNSAKNQQEQTHYLQQAAYVRLKSLQLGYTLPNSVVKRITAQRFRIFIAGENLLTFTRMHKNFDPEVENSGRSYPLQRALTAGIEIGF